MSKKRKKQKIGVITSTQIFDMQKPKYDGFICGHGAHGSKKYNRRKEKERLKRDLTE